MSLRFANERRLVPRILAIACLLASASSSEGAVRLLESDGARAIVEIVPEPALVEPHEIDGRTYVRITVPNLGVTDAPGLPELPAAAVRLAVPPNTVPRLRVLQEEWGPLQGGAVRPAPRRIGVRDPLGPSQVVEREGPEEAVYRSRTVHPETAFRLGEVMGIRHTRVVELEYHAARAEVFARGYRLLKRAI
ncbi:MAG TPA: hypothetical protein VKU85_01625, partial [bacterium]|nr:hypothetical protein [bacterium]